MGVKLYLQGSAKAGKRNKHLYVRLEKMMSERKVYKTAEQVKNKIKKMRGAYKKVKDNNRKSGGGRVTCPYFEELDSILDGDAAASPVLIMESSGK